jgi:hypothetical protein
MSPRWREALVRLHPRPWRDAHGTEFSALLEDTPWSVAAVADVVRHAARVGRQVHPRRWAALAAVVVFGLLDAVSVHSGVTHNLLWAPATPYRAFALAVTVGPLAVLGGWLVRRFSRPRREG